MSQKIFALSWKDAMVRFSSRSEILFFLILPILFTIILSGRTFSPSGGDVAESRLALHVLDKDGTAESAALLEALETSAVLHVIPANDADAAGKEALLTIPAGFGAGLLRGTAVDLNLQPQDEEMADLIFQALRSAVADESRPSDNSAYQSIGQLVTWVFIPLLGISSLLVYERTNGTLRRLLVTPTRRHTYLLGTLAGQVLLALLQMALLIGFAVFVLKVDWGLEVSAPAPLAGLILLLTAFALASAALGTALGAFVKTPRQATNLSILIGMSFALLGGAWVPLEVFPQTVRTAVKVLPTTWAMQGLMDLVIRRQGLSTILPETAVLLGFFCLFLFFGARRFRYE